MMLYDHEWAWGWWGWLGMTAGMLLFWGVLVWGVVQLVRGSARTSGRGTPEEVLAERFARGEIDESEYRRRLDTLRDRRPRPAR